MKNIPVFLTIDEKYVPYLDVAIRSLIANSNNEDNYIINVLHEKLSEKQVKELQGLNDLKENVSVRLFDMKKSLEKGLEQITDREENKLRRDYFTLSIYFRIFIPDIFKEYDKGIYIDSDVVVPGDIAEMYDVELGDNIIGACPDHSIENIEKLRYYLVNSIGVKANEYINSGVLLMNLKKMRELHFSENFLRLLNKYHFFCVAPDQDYINAMCNGKIKYLGEEWDAMPNDARKELKNPKLIHYNLFQKPWCYDNIQYEEYFWKYAKQSPYYDSIVEFKKNYSNEQKKSDSECLGKIVEDAYKQAKEDDNTLKNTFEKGEKRFI